MHTLYLKQKIMANLRQILPEIYFQTEDEIQIFLLLQTSETIHWL